MDNWFNFEILTLCDFKVLDELGTDQWPVAPGNRALRCTGVALSIAGGLLGACSAGTAARIIALVGGPCTEGPGTVSPLCFLLCLGNCIDVFSKWV